MDTTLRGIDLTDPITHAYHDLSETWRELRDNRPVHWHPGNGQSPGFWVITRHSDVSTVYRDSGTFTSTRGNVLSTLLNGGDPATGSMLAVSDGPHHAAVRRIILGQFTARRLGETAHRVRANAARRVADAVERGAVDFASEVAADIPLAATCDLLGIPLGDRPDLLRLTSSALSSDEAVSSEVDFWEARSQILLYFAALLKERQRADGDDVISVLANARVGGEAIGEEEILYNCYSLLLGGDETTRLAMIGGVHALATHDDQWQALRGGAVEVDSAVEEVLRWTTPALHAGRTATTDVVLHDVPIRAGDIVTIWNCSANADEKVFAEPARFDLNRSPNRHLTFAYGTHFCAGAHLARLEIGAVLSSLREQVSSIELTGPGRPIYSNFLHGMSSLPVELRP